MEFIVEKFKTNKGWELCYYRTGSGPVLIYLPGGGLGAMAHRNIIELLADKYSIIAIDLPGFGNSSSPDAAWTLEDYANTINRFLESLSIPDYFLVGVSLGGGVALCLAKNNLAIKRMAVIDPAGIAKLSETVFKYKFYVQKNLYDLFINRNYLFFSALKEFIGNRIKRSKEWKNITQSLKKCLLEQIQGLDAITAPTLILWARGDEIFPHKNAEVLQRKITNSKLVSVDSNHSWIVNQPQEGFRFLSEWFKKI